MENVIICDDSIGGNKKDINYQYFINGENSNHINEIYKKCNEDIRSLNHYPGQNNMDFSFYYDMAKNGKLTLDKILKINFSAESIKTLIRLYMEFKSIPKKKIIVKKIIVKKIKKENN